MGRSIHMSIFMCFILLHIIIGTSCSETTTAAEVSSNAPTTGAQADSASGSSGDTADSSADTSGDTADSAADTSDTTDSSSDSGSSDSDSDSVTTAAAAGAGGPTTTLAPTTTAEPSVELEVGVMCYCPGDDKIKAMSPQQKELITNKISQERRKEHQVFEKYFPASNATPAVRDPVPSVEILQKMFPDFDIITWAQTTEVNINAIRALQIFTKDDMDKRSRKTLSVKAALARIPQSEPEPQETTGSTSGSGSTSGETQSGISGTGPTSQEDGSTVAVTGSTSEISGSEAVPTSGSTGSGETESSQSGLGLTESASAITESVSGVTESASGVTESGSEDTAATGSTSAASGSETTESGKRRKREATTEAAGDTSSDASSVPTSSTSAPTTTTPVPLTPRRDRPMVITREHGMGVKRGATGALEDGLPCWSCSKPSTRARVELTLQEEWEKGYSNVTTQNFLDLKLKIEAAVDSVYESAAADSSVTGLSYDSGFYGSEVLALYKPEESRRRKRSTYTTIAEIEITANNEVNTNIVDQIIEEAVTAKALEGLTVDSVSSSYPSSCPVSSISFDEAKVSPTPSKLEEVAVGMKVLFSCVGDNLMNATYDPEDDGYGLLCGSDGKFVSPIFPDDLCVSTVMCRDVPSVPGMTLQPAVRPVLDQEAVYYACNNPLEVLDDGSGLAVYTAVCNNSKLLDGYIPKCVEKPRCKNFPEPDNMASMSSLELVCDEPQCTPGGVALFPGEFATYNCTDKDMPVTEFGPMFPLECKDGNFTPPDVWPECKEAQSCNVTLGGVPTPPPETYLVPHLPEGIEVKEFDFLNYTCSGENNKTYIENNPTNTFKVMCGPGAVWESVSSWATCNDTTTTTAAPTTTTPMRRRDCYCLGDIAKSASEKWIMNEDRHRAILKICRENPVTFRRNKEEMDENGKRVMVPIKEQCGVKNPYVREYGAARNFTYEDVCACHSSKVYGIWVTMEMENVGFSSTMEKLTSRQGRIMKNAIEERLDDLYILEGLPYSHRFMRTRVMRFAEGETITNAEEGLEAAEEGTEFVPIRSTRVMIEVQFVGNEDMTVDEFNKTHLEIIGRNTTLVEDPLMIINLGCEQTDNPLKRGCPVTKPPACLNKDFEAIPDYLTHQYVRTDAEGNDLPFPYNWTDSEGLNHTFHLVVGDTIDFKCKDPLNVKVFYSDPPDPELEDNVYTIFCKPDKYYTVPKGGLWPLCKAKCAKEKPLPENGTNLVLWVNHTNMINRWDKEFYEEDELYYTCTNPKFDGVVVNEKLVGKDGGMVGDRRTTNLKFKCTKDGSYNTPLKFPSCAPKPEVCECLGDLNRKQSKTILDMMCRNDSLSPDNYHYNVTQDRETYMIIANKTRCGVKKPDWPTLEEKCYCFQMDMMGVRTGFWHTMEVLSLPWHPDLAWPNTTMFKQNKIRLEKELDEMYFNSTTIFETLRYVRSIVMKFSKGKYQLQHLTSTTTTSTTTTTTSTSTTIPKRGKREAEDGESTVPPIPREDRECPNPLELDPPPVCIGAKGLFEHPLEVYSTTAWVEHQFMEDFSILDYPPREIVGVDSSSEWNFQKEHLALLERINGQWLDETGNMTLWLSQGCYQTGKCSVTDMQRCMNAVLKQLPFGFTHEKIEKMVDSLEESEKVEYALPVGAEVNIKCKEHHKKITVDELDANPNDMLMTVHCMPSGNFDLPREGFPKCKSYCPAPELVWNLTQMEKQILPLQKRFLADPSSPVPKAISSAVGYRAIEPSSYTGLTLHTDLSPADQELWVGDKLYFSCINQTLGVEQGASPMVGFLCREDGTYGVPLDQTWPECDIKTTTAKAAIVMAVLKQRQWMDDDLTQRVLWADYQQLAAQLESNSDMIMRWTIPSAVVMLFLLVGCLLCTRRDGLFCQVINRDYELRQMQNYGHKDYHYS